MERCLLNVRVAIVPDEGAPDLVSHVLIVGESATMQSELMVGVR